MLAALLLTVLPASAALASRADLLRAHGIRPLQPAPAAPGFTLPTLAGTERSLADFRGDWVVLTFFATWCAPCRSEMPTLERLHREASGAGVLVVAVSLDRRLEPVGPFAEQLELSFPILWDRNGEVGDAYRAASIPVSFLVDREGSVAGVAHGSRDWSRSASLFASLDGLPAAAAGTAAPVAATSAGLPVAEPPTASWILPDAPPRPGRPFTLGVRLDWSGRLEEYLPQPPALELPEGLAQRSVTAASSSADGGHSVLYRIELVAEKAGSYDLDPIELRYLPAGASGPVSTLVTGPTVEVAEPSGPGLWMASGAAGLALAGAAVVWLRRRRAAARAASQPADRLGELRRELDRARGRRLAGEPAAAFEALTALARQVESEAERRDLEEQTGAVRFGGRIPDSGQLEAVERRLARALDRLLPDPDHELRSRLRLADKPPTPSEETIG